MFDPTPVTPDMNLFEQQDWPYSPYGCEVLVEELPSNLPKPCGPSMTMRVLFGRGAQSTTLYGIFNSRVLL
jgi:hypothetical protein